MWQYSLTVELFSANLRLLSANVKSSCGDVRKRAVQFCRPGNDVRSLEKRRMRGVRCFQVVTSYLLLQLSHCVSLSRVSFLEERKDRNRFQRMPPWKPLKTALGEMMCHKRWLHAAFMDSSITLILFGTNLGLFVQHSFSQIFELNILAKSNLFSRGNISFAFHLFFFFSKLIYCLYIKQGF